MNSPFAMHPHDRARYDAAMAVLQSHSTKILPDEFRKITLRAFDLYALAGRRGQMMAIRSMLEKGTLTMEAVDESLAALAQHIDRQGDQLYHLMGLVQETLHPDATQ